MTLEKVLIVSENPEELQRLSDLLSEVGFQPIATHSAQETLTLAVAHLPDAIVLDLELTSMGPRQLIEKLREWYLQPVLILSPPLSERDTAVLLDLGADGILVKPWGSIELPARIRAAIRLGSRQSNAGTLTGSYRCKELFIDFTQRQVMLGQRKVHLTQIEYRIVQLLARNAGKLMTHQQIMERIWGPYHNENNKILRVNITNIRRKLESSSSNPQYILTENGIGYRMPPSEEAV